MQRNIEINHAEYPESLRSKSRAELLFIMKDASEARAANPYGPKAGYYADEIHYAGKELRKRDLDEAVAQLLALGRPAWPADIDNAARPYKLFHADVKKAYLKCK
jgi:hypothetical protein